MTKTARRKPASFRVEDVEIVMPPEPAPLPDAPETQAEVKDLPKLERGLRWGSIFLGALGGLISLLLSLWLYDYVLALIARDDWIGWGAVVLLGLVVVALLMIVLRELVGLFRLGRLGKIRHEADSAARQDDKPMAVDVTRRLKRFYSGREDLAWGMQRLAEHERDILRTNTQSLAMMLRKCAHRLKCNGHEDLSADVVGLLRRYGLLGSPLRGAEAEHG